jgi:putative intracellular protease/amidase
MKILMVLTSHDVLGNTGHKTGFWLEEFAAPYFVFRDAGVQLTLASPKGGQPLDPKSDLPENQTPAMMRFKQDPTAQKALSQMVKLADQKAEDFDTVFYVGGHGPMWDLAESPGFHRFTRVLLQFRQADRFGLPLARRASSRDLLGCAASKRKTRDRFY